MSKEIRAGAVSPTDRDGLWWNGCIGKDFLHKLRVSDEVINGDTTRSGWHCRYIYQALIRGL